MEVNDISSSAIQNIPQKTSAPSQPEQWQRELEKAADGKAPQARQTSPSSTLTRAEQTYFEELFPTSAPELQAYSLYKNDGSRSASSLGTVVDRKG
jgi:hypothetical protein